ncbi:DUF2800 domain-containing protein [Bradyrhizobium sp.]|jgi:hypothetical protein|uniref:DUF2800 domain-containing protein n=1 Tax=Bradyrhizobium sp. TaxID=376 RepID=UPI002DDC960B|nr:DUF2800 domain-containing protein [Bradyrhizobium sp.]HEV2155452.1 DUF2800 domain-containing protein [Bradyrhizobium sp.]
MTKLAVHADRDHATWAASSTARNWNCSGAIALNRRNPAPEVESEAAAWGTACHQLAEKCFKHNRHPDEYIGTVETTKQHKIDVDGEVAETTEMYVDYVRGRIAAYVQEFGEEPIVVHEQPLPLDRLGGPYDAGGTGDTVMYFPRWKLLEVVDLKGGRGLVEAADNKQLRTYGLGSLLANPGLDVEKVKTTIVQPRAPHKDGKIRSDEPHVADLVEWTAELLERMKLAKQADDEFETMAFAAWSAKWLKPGNCKFCPSEGNCPALKQRALDAAHVWFDDLDRPQISNKAIFDTPEQIAADLDMLDMIQDWISARRALAHKMAEGGTEIPNYILVPQQKREKWKDGEEEAVLNILDHSELKPEKYLNPAKLKTPKQVRKALGKKESLVAGLSETPAGGTNLVRADKTTRQAIPSGVNRFFNDESAT